MQAIINNDEKILAFSGTNNVSILFNDINILDTTTMTWSTLIISQNVPYPRIDFTATLLPTGHIIYLGGNGIRNSMSECFTFIIPTFDKNSLNWSTKDDDNEIRIGHSTVLSQRVNPDLAVLNTNIGHSLFQNISQTNAPPPLALHSAGLYKGYMIAFGVDQIVGRSRSIVGHTNIYFILD
ncbi:hypothetical protein C2G38_2158275 [Gigaspora rosea]|uniref:Galactose oxidase n=1 Tax=Gigaspora rosea TaxID=44941 RepID=A0A397W0K7_9GLOM|nr:hypothetical protein C2G38_2158275 [Gigaspora rosea]